MGLPHTLYAVDSIVALFTPGFSTCSLCGKMLLEDIENDDNVVGTTCFISNPDDPLFPYSDSLMHRDCFRKWEHRAGFVAAYNASDMKDVHYMGSDGVIRERILLWFPIAVMEIIARWFPQSTDKRQ